MTKIREVCQSLEELAHPKYQEDYDNVGLLVGDDNSEVSGALCTLDVTDRVIEEAIVQNCNLIVAHHPLIFRGLKRINGSTYVEKVVIKAIKSDIAIYAIHTNLDNVLYGGLNMQFGEIIGLNEIEILRLNPRFDTLEQNNFIGSGILGYLKKPLSPQEFIQHLKDRLQINIIRHSPLLNFPIEKVAFCGGAGSFLLNDAIEKKAHAFISADFKYHEFFDANGQIIIFDIGHFESEKHTIMLLQTYLSENFSNFASLYSKVNTNPINYS